MKNHPIAEPLPQKNRKRTFRFLLLIFLVAIPFLYLYATGYRIDFEKPTNLISTGGIYIAVDSNDTELYVDSEPVDGARTFRKAFYVQNLDEGTHRVHVQLEDSHTWVKELPVYKHLVTEAQSFNLPLVSQVRVISEFESATGTPIIFEPISVIASTTNDVLSTTTIKNPDFVLSDEYQGLMAYFSTSTATSTEDASNIVLDIFTEENATSTSDEIEATSTIMTEHARLYESGEDIYTTWTGSFEQMPYYYCTEDFLPYSTSTASSTEVDSDFSLIKHTEAIEDTANAIHPIQAPLKDAECDPTIRIDRMWQTISDFDFFQGNTDFVIEVLEDGVYVVEVDDRAWQNVQPLLLGTELKMHTEGDNVYIYDGTLIYEIILETS